MGRCYVRNGVWGWSLEEQETALAAAGALEPDRLYRDELPASRAKMPARVRPEWLEQREAMFRPTGRAQGDTIHVATILALGINEADLVRTLTRAWERRSAIREVSNGFAVTWEGGGPAIIDLAVQRWLVAKRDAQTKPGRRLGNQAAAEAKKARTMAKLPEARKLWRLPTVEITSSDIAARVGLSVKTLYTYLGRREVAQRRRKKRG